MKNATWGATADSTSIGFSGSMNASTSGTNTCVAGTITPGIDPSLDISDWHGYALHSSSFYRGKASDGTDLGVNISAIDAAQTSTQYVCQSACGAGPTPD